MAIFSLSMNRVRAVICFLAMSLPFTTAWSSCPSAFKTATGRRKHQQTSTAPNDVPVVRDPLITSHNMLRESGFSSFHLTQENVTGRKETIKFSHSKMSQADGFSAVPVAHGMLSPQIVMRLQELTRLHRHRSPALDSFLDSYYTKGPMSCVPMLSDPDVLPHLTMAMRYVSV